MSIEDDFKARFPDFPEAAIDSYFDSVLAVWPCYYTGAYDACNKEIILNLIAHLIIMESNPKASSIRSVSSRSAGSVSTSYGGVSKQTDLTDFFGFSIYGQRFLFLTSRNKQRAYFV